MKVFVLNQNGKPLMPCSPTKARKLIENREAVIKKHSPFTIQLTVPVSNNMQKTTLGIDMGYSHIGFSSVTDKQELICGTLEQETIGKNNNPTSKRLEDRLMYRRIKRSRLWYRESRWKNRTKSKKEGWISPSISRKYLTHISLINRLKRILPISKTIVENGKFDIQKLDNPDIEGVGYQQGTLYNYMNQKSYLLDKQEGKCGLCGEGYKESDGWHLHHIKPRSQGGSNNVDNLVLLHNSCHIRLHKEGLKLSKVGFKKKHKGDSFMNIVRKKVKKELDCETTYGYITSLKRREFDIEKTHYNDAFVIAGGEKQIRTQPFVINQKRINNRSLQNNNLHTKGGRSIRRSRNKFQSGDLVWVGGKMIRCGGTTKGYVIIGTEINKNGNRQDITVSSKKIEKHFRNGSLIFKQVV